MPCVRQERPRSPETQRRRTASETGVWSLFFSRNLSSKRKVSRYKPIVSAGLFLLNQTTCKKALEERGEADGRFHAFPSQRLFSLLAANCIKFRVFV